MKLYLTIALILTPVAAFALWPQQGPQSKEFTPIHQAVRPTQSTTPKTPGTQVAELSGETQGAGTRKASGQQSQSPTPSDADESLPSTPPVELNGETKDGPDRLAQRLGIRYDTNHGRDLGILMHSSAQIDEKASALRRLDVQSFVAETEYRDAAATEEVRWMLSNVQDPEVKEEILRGLNHYEGDELVDPVLELLRQDPDAVVRRRAADVLKSHISEPRVYEALLASARDDQDQKVRDEASFSR